MGQKESKESEPSPPAAEKSESKNGISSQGDVDVAAASPAEATVKDRDKPSPVMVQKRPAKSPAAARDSKRISFYETVDASEVLPYLIIGNLASSKNQEFLTRKNVKYVLNLTSETDEIEAVEYKNIPLEDDDDQELLPHFESCFDFINKAAKDASVKEKKGKENSGSAVETVLVHSYFGMSRSSAVVIAYLMKEKNWTLREAYEYLKERHSSVNPNDNFVVQLIRYEQEMFNGKMSMTITDFHQ